MGTPPTVSQAWHWLRRFSRQPGRDTDVCRTTWLGREEDYESWKWGWCRVIDSLKPTQCVNFSCLAHCQSYITSIHQSIIIVVSLCLVLLRHEENVFVIWLEDCASPAHLSPRNLTAFDKWSICFAHWSQNTVPAYSATQIKILMYYQS